MDFTQGATAEELATQLISGTGTMIRRLHRRRGYVCSDTEKHLNKQISAALKQARETCEQLSASDTNPAADLSSTLIPQFRQIIDALSGPAAHQSSRFFKVAADAMHCTLLGYIWQLETLAGEALSSQFSRPAQPGLKLVIDNTPKPKP